MPAPLIASDALQIGIPAYDEADTGDARYGMWLRLAIWLRATLIAGASGWLAWSGILQPIRRKLRTISP